MPLSLSIVRRRPSLTKNTQGLHQTRVEPPPASSLRFGTGSSDSPRRFGRVREIAAIAATPPTAVQSSPDLSAAARGISPSRAVSMACGALSMDHHSDVVRGGRYEDGSTKGMVVPSGQNV